MILSAQTIRRMGIISPFCERTEYRWDSPFLGRPALSYGLSAAGYDVRCEFDSKGLAKQGYVHHGQMMLASTIEHFSMPDDVIGIVHDKSTLARLGIAVQNTVIEPGWRGHLTLEISYHGHAAVYLFERGQPIAQIVFHKLDEPTEQPYSGKYQGQPRGPMSAL